MSALTLAKISSSLMIQGPTDQKVNAGLNLKFEAKSQKVLGYTRKNEGGWEYSERAIALIAEYKAAFPEIIDTFDQRKGTDLRNISDFFPNLDAKGGEAKMREIKLWLKEKGVDDFEKVPLDSEQLDKATVQRLEQLADHLTSQKNPDNFKHVQVKSIPRKALLKPEAAQARLQHQMFSLGDRVIMAAETGNVPLCTKGTIVGIRTDFMDVIWDVTFIGGTNLGDRCSQYRGLPVAPWTLLNLSNPQVQVQLGNPATMPPAARGRGRGRGFFTPAPVRGNASPRGQNGPVRILQNNRGRGASNGTNFANNYQAAATNGTGAYTQPIPANQQARLRNALNNGAAMAAANSQTYENNAPARQALKDYSRVPAPANLNSSPGRGAARMFRAAVRGGAPSTRPVNGESVPTEPAAQRTTEARGGFRGRARARGRGAPRTNGTVVDHVA